MKKLIICALVAVFGVVAWGATASAHEASVGCGRSGDVYVLANWYNAAQYRLNGGAWIDFQGTLSLSLDGSKVWRVEIRADDWPRFDQTVGPCQQPTTTTIKETPTSTSTTTSPSTSSTSTTAPATSAPQDSTTSTSSPVTSEAGSTTTTGCVGICRPATIEPTTTVDDCRWVNSPEGDRWESPTGAPCGPSTSVIVTRSSTTDLTSTTIATGSPSPSSTTLSDVLPVTGSKSDETALIAGGFCLLGAMALLIARRRTVTS